MELADFEKMNQVRARVDEIVEDPATAEALKPWYRQFCKRPTFNDDYLPTFNRPNVTLVDTEARASSGSPRPAWSPTASSTRSTASSSPPASRSAPPRRGAPALRSRPDGRSSATTGPRAEDAARLLQPRLPELLLPWGYPKHLDAELSAHAGRTGAPRCSCREGRVGATGADGGAYSRGGVAGSKPFALPQLTPSHSDRPALRAITMVKGAPGKAKACSTTFMAPGRTPSSR